MKNVNHKKRLISLYKRFKQIVQHYFHHNSNDTASDTIVKIQAQLANV